jgi:hypothetical protein
MLELLTWKLASELLGTAADAHGLGATGVVRGLLARFQGIPQDAQVFAHGMRLAAAMAVGDVVTEVYRFTRHEEWPGKAEWNRFRTAHEKVMKDRAWRSNGASGGDPAFGNQLMASLQQLLNGRLDGQIALGAGEVEASMWVFYCAELHRVDFADPQPPEIVRQAFFGERPEPNVWSWSKHFSRRVGELLCNDSAFRTIFSALQIDAVGGGVRRLIEASEQWQRTLADLRGAMGEYFGRIEQKLDRALASKDAAPGPEEAEQEHRAFVRWYMHHVITTGRLVHVDPWSYGSTPEELAFKALMRGRDKQSFELIDAHDYGAVVDLWAPLQDDQYFSLDHDEWQDKPYFRCAIQIGKSHLFMAYVQLGQNDGLAEHGRKAFELLSEILTSNPYSMEGASHDRLPPDIAEIQNENYRTTLLFAAQWIDMLGPLVLTHLCGVPKAELERVERRRRERLTELDYLLQPMP